MPDVRRDFPADGVTTIASGGACMVRNTTSSAFIVVSGDPIAERAYDIYVERGRVDGSDLDDWLRAEREFNAMRAAAPGKGPTLVKKRATIKRS